MKKTVTAVLCMTMVVCNTLKSQENMKTTSEKMPFAYVDAKTIKSHNSNPFGLVYADAIKENVKGNVNILPITYDLNGLKISANIYVPATCDAAKSYPALVVAHPNGGVKEQVSGLYSQRMAEAGYICLAFDAAYQGASEGEPRNTDKPAYRIEDIRRAADILLQYPGVDANRVGILGICGGGGYTLKAVQAAKLPFDLYRDGYEYYLQSHAHPNSTFRYTKSSLVDLFAFDASEGMYLINQPLLMMAGSIADTFYMTELCYSKATGTGNKELFLIPGAMHIVTHSAGGFLGWMSAMQNKEVKGIVSYEPGGFVFPEGEVPAPIDGLTGGVSGIPVPPEQFEQLTKIPVVLYFGDYIPETPSLNLGDENWRVRLQMARRFVETINKHGGNATLIELPKIGVYGNTHFLMQDLNNDELADLLERWLIKNDLI